MRNFKLTLEYDGGGFAGFQLQPGQRTVQGVLEHAVKSLTGEDRRVLCAGRTDAGVHALGQVANFKTERDFPEFTFRRGLNRFLPDDVTVLSAEEVPEDFDPRRDATGKWYRYLILDGAERTTLWKDRAWRMLERLDLEPMREAAQALIGAHDFSSFRSTTCEATSPVKEMRRIEIYRRRGLIVMDMRAKSFLKQMARAIAGTLAETGQGRRGPGEMAAILAARDRTQAGATAPAHGLYLMRVEYDK